MNVHRRVGLGVLLMALLVAVAGRADAQVTKEISAEAFAVLKFNNPEAISAKVAGLGQKLGIANFVPQLADLLGTLKQQLNLKEGLDAKGEVAVVFFMPPEGESDPQVLIYIPVSDYEAFLKNLANVKSEGEVSQFSMADDNDPIYVVNWGSYAVVTPWKSLIEKKPAGALQVTGAAASHIQSTDVVLLTNPKVVAAKLLPELLANRDRMMKEAEQNVPPALVPASKAVASQLLTFAENVLKQGQAVTLGLSLSDKGINLSTLVEFEPSGSLGQMIAGIKNSPDAALLAGLPSHKYLMFGGVQLDPAWSTKLYDDTMGPIQTALDGVNEAAMFVKMMAATKSMLEGTNKVSIGWAPAAADAKSPLAMQQASVFSGDSKKVQAGLREFYQGLIEVMKLVPQEGGVSVQAELKPDSKVVDGINLDQITVQMKMDANNPMAAQAAGLMGAMMGPEGTTTTAGPVGDQAFVSVTGGDEFLAGVIASAKASTDVLSPLAGVKAVSEQLPKNKVAVLFVAVDQMVAAGLKFAEQMGMPIPLKLPADMPPIGIAIATEGSAIRGEMHLSADLMAQLMAAGFQVMQIMQGGGAAPAPAPQ